MSEILTEVPAKRHVENEAIREAARRFMLWKGHMDFEGRDTIGASTLRIYAREFIEACERATEGYWEEYT